MNKIKKVNQTLGFFSMTIAWLMMNFLYVFYQLLLYGHATDLWAMIFWTAIFIFLAWLIFIILPIHLLDHSGRIFKPMFFPFVTGMYGLLSFVILVGGLFQDLDLVLSFSPLAFVTGLIFGLTYFLVMRASRLVNLLKEKPILNLLFFLFPIAVFAIFYVANNEQ